MKSDTHNASLHDINIGNIKFSIKVYTSTFCGYKKELLHVKKILIHTEMSITASGLFGSNDLLSKFHVQTDD